MRIPLRILFSKDAVVFFETERKGPGFRELPTCNARKNIGIREEELEVDAS